MKSIIMFETNWCPYCKNARDYIEELMQENPQYKSLDIKIVDEELDTQISNEYDYYYVPTFFVDNEKAHEGIPSKAIVHEIFEKALSS